MSRTPTYDALLASRRLDLERRLYERIFGEPYTERSIPEDASPRQQEYLISCIRNAIHTRNDGRVIPPRQLDATRELNAGGRPAGLDAPPLVTAGEARRHKADGAKERMYRLCAEGKLPHRLEDYFIQAEVLMGQASGAPLYYKQWVLADQILVPEGTRIEGLRIDPESQRTLLATVKGPILPERPARVNGIDCRVLVARETGIPRRQLAEKFLKPLGYKHCGARGSQGYVAFEKTRSDGATLAVDFDFGTWRASIMALFAYSGGGFSLRFPLQYWREAEPIAIVTRAMFARTMENVAFVAKELEDFLAENSPPS